MLVPGFQKKTDQGLLSNWRPITLLNVDYKIASKAIAKSVENVLPKVINQDQTGFVKVHWSEYKIIVGSLRGNEKAGLTRNSTSP